jgi:hypothetical protein
MPNCVVKHFISKGLAELEIALGLKINAYGCI